MPIITTEEFIKQILAENTEFKQTISELNQTIKEMSQTIKDLQERLNKNSENSSKPPSSDGLKKPIVNKNRSLRKSTEKKQGGQDGHTGKSLSIIAEPDETKHHMHEKCTACPNREACIEKACIKETRHEVDIVVAVHITAHQLVIVESCLLYGDSKQGSFPNNIKSTVQYGQNLQALVVTLNTVGAVSINRTHEILGGVFNIPISTGTIKNMVTRCANRLEATYEGIRQKMLTLTYINCDETGTRADGKTCWVHNASDADYTYLTISDRRGQIGMNEAQVLPYFKGTIVHDCWGSYWKYQDVTHSICCAHLLRELKGVEQNAPHQLWATKFKKLLLSMKLVKDKALANDKTNVSYYHLHKFAKQYDEIIKIAYDENPTPEITEIKRGRKKKSKVLNLISRLDKYKAPVCLFLKELHIPFDNNQAERDIRMVKVKTKVSGCFRSMNGAKEYLRIMSYIGTARKQGINSYKAIQNAISGNPSIAF